MKVSEAKEKLCPFMSNQAVKDLGHGVQSVRNNCICGDCMAWQWTVTNEEGHVDDIDSDEEQEGYCIRLKS